MLCQHCQQDRDEQQEGRTYIFFYGNQSGARMTGISRRVVQFKINGSEKPFLCHDCVFAYAMQKRAVYCQKWGIALILITSAVALLSLFSLDGDISYMLRLGAGLGLAYALALFLLAWIEKQRIENRDYAHLAPALRSFRGSSLAIAMRADDLRTYGYNAFFTPRSLKRMTRLARVPGGEKQAG